MSVLDRLDAVVVGGGHAGLGIGFYLQEAGCDFVILERGRVGESWRTQRWDSFTVNTPNWANVLPGDTYDGDRADGFYHRDELVVYLESYVARFGLPVVEGATVTSVTDSGEGFIVSYRTHNGVTRKVGASNVVVASGAMNQPKIPASRDEFPGSMAHLHASEYRSAAHLPDGAVVVVGSGQSGCQITADLLSSGREVYLCTSRVARLRRRYRNRDIVEWADDMGFWDHAVDELEDPAVQFAAQPQISGVGRYGETLSLQSLARDGARLMGRLEGVEGGVLRTDHSLTDHIAFADEQSAGFVAMIEEWIEANDLNPDEIEHDPNDEPGGPEVAEAGTTRLDLAASNVGSVIWCTGFTAEFDWLHVPVTDTNGLPVHTRGISQIPGIYFVGLPWQHTRKSGVILGISEDARFVAEAISTPQR